MPICIIRTSHRLIVICLFMLIALSAYAKKRKIFLYATAGFGKTHIDDFKAAEAPYGANYSYDAKEFSQFGIGVGYSVTDCISAGTGVSIQHYHFVIREPKTGTAIYQNDIREDFISIPVFVQYNVRLSNSYSVFLSAGFRYLSVFSDRSEGNFIYTRPGPEPNINKTAFAPMLSGGLCLHLKPASFLMIGPDIQYHTSNAFTDEPSIISGHLWQVSAKVTFGFALQGKGAGAGKLVME